MSRSIDAQRSGPDWRVALALGLLPLALYLAKLGRWSLDGDEWYTYVDSAQPLSDLLQTQVKPLYYAICHFLLRLGLDVPLEILLRAPAALAAAAAPPCAYWLSWTPERDRAALFTGVLLATSPWLFRFAQFARFYSLQFVLALIATLLVLRWLEQGRPRRLGFAAGFALLATSAQTTAGVLFPAAAVAIAFFSLQRDASSAWAFLRRYAWHAAALLLLFALATWSWLGSEFLYWMQAAHGDFGHYTLVQLGLGLAVNVGLQVWALALLPMVRSPRDWTRLEIFCLLIFAVGVAPLVLLAGFGGGVAPRYLAALTPPIFLLAAVHWAEIHRALEGRRPALRAALAATIVALSVPFLASTLQGGDHFDYRAAARYVDSLDIEEPAILASGHELFEHYLERDAQLAELTSFEYGFPYERVLAVIEQGQADARPLLLVSREDRTRLSTEDQRWFYRRFALLRSFESGRYDHRRFRIAVYEYRPSSLPAR